MPQPRAELVSYDGKDFVLMLVATGDRYLIERAEIERAFSVPAREFHHKTMVSVPIKG